MSGSQQCLDNTCFAGLSVDRCTYKIRHSILRRTANIIIFISCKNKHINGVLSYLLVPSQKPQLVLWTASQDGGSNWLLLTQAIAALNLLHSTSVEGYREMDAAPISGSIAGYILCVPLPVTVDRGVGQPSEHNHKPRSGGGQSSPGDSMNLYSPAYITKWTKSWHFRVLSCSVLLNSRLCHILSY